VCFRRETAARIGDASWKYDVRSRVRRHQHRVAGVADALFRGAKNAETLGGDLEALVQYVESLPQPFIAPNPGQERRITSEG
jgi:hypothetical protein